VNFVLDTNAVSELRKPCPNSNYITWVNAQDPAHLFVTTISLGEVSHGFHRLPPGHADFESIKRFATNLPRAYNVLNFDQRAAAIWGELTTIANAPLPLRDSFIGAIARSRGYRLVTRDVAPFERMGCKVVNPWRRV
jgi:toxin FitB